MTISLRALLVAALATVALATPVPNANPEADIALERRQITNSKDLENGDCKPVAFIFARGSTETGNMVSNYRTGPHVPSIGYGNKPAQAILM